MTDKKIALITGAAGDLGLVTAKLLARNNWTVYARDYNTNALENLNNLGNIVPIFTDVSVLGSNAFYTHWMNTTQS